MLRDLFRLALGARLPKKEGRLRVSGLHSRVFVRRDAFGVPHIEADNDEDAFFAMGFVVAQDRAFHLELYMRAARGTLAEIIGPEMLDVDRLSRRIGFTHIARAQLAAMDPANRAQLEAYACGVNEGVRRGLGKVPHEHALLGIEPSVFHPTDVAAVLQFFAFALSSNWDAELARLGILVGDGPEALAALETAHPSWLLGSRDLEHQVGENNRLRLDIEALRASHTLARVATQAGRLAGLRGGSNQWALAASRTSTGRPLLACDPHLAPTLPSPWYLLHLRTPSWAMSGACLVSQPTITFGHNEHVAWGVTAGHADNTDLFLERIGPDRRSVLEGQNWVPCDVREEVIRVKGGEDVRERVLVTRRGPIVSPLLGANQLERADAIAPASASSSEIALSLRGTWMAARPIRYDHFRARSVEDARLVYRSYPAVSENRVFADTTGRIAWQLAGDLPVRKKGHGLVPMPGWDPSVGWEDAPLPFEDMPFITDPDTGFVATANNCPVIDTGVFLGADWLDAHRYERIVGALAARTDWSVADAQRLQTDRTTVLWPRLKAPILDALVGDRRVEVREARRFLQEWNGVVSADSIGASVFELILVEMMNRVVRAKAPVSARAALGEGINAILPHGIMALRRTEHLARLLCEAPNGWFSQGWNHEIREAAVHAVERLRTASAKRGSGWAWGHVRPLTLVHPTGSKSPLDRVFNRGPLIFGGDASTIPQASVDYHDPFGNPVGIPNLRMVIDVGNWEASRYVLAGGQSGNPLSNHYDDMLPLWERGEGRPIAFGLREAKDRARETLELVPLTPAPMALDVRAPRR
jgi:penicillin G amidase